MKFAIRIYVKICNLKKKWYRFPANFAPDGKVLGKIGIWANTVKIYKVIEKDW